MQIDDAGFQNHMALTLLEGLFGMEGQQMPKVNEQQNIVDMGMSKLANVKMDTASADVVSSTGTSVLGWPTCKDTLACNFNILQSVSLSDRLIYLVTIQVKLLSGPNKSQTQFKAIEGLMQYFIDKNLPNPNIAPSYGLAGVLEGIQRGTAIALGKSNDTFGNPSSILWANFLRKAFQVGLNYGIQTGDRLTGTTVGVNDYVEISERAAVFTILTAWTILAQNEGVIGRVFSLVFETDQANTSKSAPGVFLPLYPYGFTAKKFHCIFNVSDPKPLYCLVDVAFHDRAIAALRIETTTFLNDINNLVTIIPAFMRCYAVGANI
ncbi:unnamed protein product [Sordaria macrospora k-hell]|uniref:WGS project CABT00000000 data, contig 2.2 n=2 Tax=Sordaria macrospora TaxID=5147 RepID=F7VMV5_SORMK|nr:uncharacterized protein SMAC_00710 [Sordaria macrospora k-hell]KAH7630156.1 hypothetical protein B0T09DRAFT_264276 [Sordaria sp. MPI-SDFR-AT-0083]CCC06684.1 unnamed protein product [Sordaria macrospora k-hell]